MALQLPEVCSAQHWLVCRSSVRACRPAMLSAIALLLASGLTQAGVSSRLSRSLQPHWSQLQMTLKSAGQEHIDTLLLQILAGCNRGQLHFQRPGLY